MRLWMAAAIAMSLIACGEEKKVEFDPHPKLELTSVAPSSLKALLDTLRVTVRYSDGDGDLGHAHPDSHAVFATDSRNGVVHRFRLPPLAPDDQGPIPITGNLVVVIGGIPNLSGRSENVGFEIFLKDRAGNRSNVVSTPPVEVLP
ncbi:MAG: hypothetical protein RMM53_05070 [Bacteroidia bacterium]|nr:hypothetical protein [Bacteroidia bacterium]MDW8333570.1 hypothetical protein [Bacteroidia bacterium]